MLQINSGKLFTTPVGRTNALRGVLYSNIRLWSHDIETVAGTMRQTDGDFHSNAVVYEIEERIEEQIPDFFVSHMVSPYLRDFSALATFGLRAIVSPDAALVQRLCSNDPGLSSHDGPRAFVARYFDERLHPSDEESADFTAFTAKLIALDRKNFLAAMRAIRTFVSGLFRLRDDLALSYTLFVSAIESLAQAFDGYATRWEDVDARKRDPLDVVLADVPAATAAKVREAVIGAEHPSLARRYRAFVLDHIGPDYFRDLASGRPGPVARHELDAALRQAYMIRSRYIHNLRRLPDALTLPHGGLEIAHVERVPALTFEGIVRLTHHVIRAFVLRGAEIDHEPYDYTLEQSGVRTVMLAPELWVARPLTQIADSRLRLEGLLEQLVPVLVREADAKITDIRPVYPDIERHLKTGAARHKPALLAFYALFRGLLGDAYRSPPLEAELERLAGIFEKPSSEALIMNMLFDEEEKWSLAVHARALDMHIAGRASPKGLHTPKLLDAALCIALAERFRAAGESSEARQRLALAVECLPGHPVTTKLERNYRKGRELDWREILMPEAFKAKRRAKSRKSGNAKSI